MIKAPLVDYGGGSPGDANSDRGSQNLQNPLIKEYTLNYNGIPNML